MPKVMISLNAAWNLLNFRAGLIRALITAGYEVVAVAPADEYAPRLMNLGCRYVPLPMDSQGTHPGRDLLLLWRFYHLMRRERPNIFLGYTIKPNVYGSLAAHALGIPVINNIAGLGAVFVNETWLTNIARQLYKLALSRSKRVFFQNEADRKLFIDSGIVRAERTSRLPGSGIDLERFSMISVTGATAATQALAFEEKEQHDLSPATHPQHISPQKFRFLLLARMLWDKGVGEYVDAARHVRRQYPQAEFYLLGFLDVKNPAAISRQQMQVWVDEGIVNYLGVSDDVRFFIAKVDCVVLPSFYREGIPRSLLEAAAMGRTIITTDSIGCRDVVDDGVNGFLCQGRNAHDLAQKMKQIMALSPEARAEMGRQGRLKMEREFDEKIVITKYLDMIRELI